MCELDHDTVAAGDKFGNLVVLRLPDTCDDNIEVDTGIKALWDMGGRPKLQMMTHYYLGEMITALSRCSLMPGAPEVLIAATVTGGIYAFLPLSSKEDITFFSQMEMFLRQECPNLCGRDHISFRSFYQPVKHTIDGDLFDLYASLSAAKQLQLAEGVGRTPVEVFKKLEEIRHVL